MNIGIAVDGKDLNSIVSEKFKTCNYLLIVNIRDNFLVESVEILGFKAIKNQENDLGFQLTKELIKYNCEAMITGELEPPIFNFIADACITRYNGTGYSANIALEMMEKRKLKLIRNTDGIDGCDSSHHKH